MNKRKSFETRMLPDQKNNPRLCRARERARERAAVQKEEAEHAGD